MFFYSKPVSHFSYEHSCPVRLLAFQHGGLGDVETLAQATQGGGTVAASSPPRLPHSRVIPHPSFASKEIMAQLQRPIIIFCRNSLLDQ